MDTPYEPETIGPLMARLRKARGYSQEIVAQRLCALSESNTVTRQIVSRWERQERVPSEYWLLHIADVLSVPIDLLRGACAAARGVKQSDPGGANRERDRGGPLVTSWLTLHHGPTETVIALGGVEVDQLRTVLAPINTADPVLPNLRPISEHM